MFWIRNFKKCGQIISTVTHRAMHFEPKEIKVPVPWGHVAARHWNESKLGVPVLCLHGWKDNASTFDRLIPLILENTDKFQFVCLDLPGHGLSSHYPPGMLYQMVDMMVVIRRVLRHFDWSETDGVHLLGHSLGGILGFLFAANHPQMVDCLIAIDGLVPIMFSRGDVLGMVNLTTDGILHLESEEFIKKSGRTYDKPKLLNKMLSSHMFGLDKVACEILLTRGVVEVAPNSGKFRFSHDPRIHFLPLMGFSPGQIRNQAYAFRSKLLYIKAENGVTYLSDYVQADIKGWLARDNKKLIRFITAKQASHHVHLVEPEKIKSDIVQFLLAAH